MKILPESTLNSSAVGDSLNLPDHRYKRRCCSLIPAESDSLPHTHAQSTKTYYKHQDSRIKKAQELKTKTSTNSGKFTLSPLDELQGFSFFLQMGFTLILATLDGLDVGLLGDVIGEDDCDDDG
ncbi:hypothetical protein Tco_0425781 [Tanacetum coccineum]